MASFYAELEIEGSTYPVRHCEFEFNQTTNARGRVNAKVRHKLLHLTLDVPDDDRLLAWAAAPHKPLAGHVTFFETDQRTARETLRFAAGQCVVGIKRWVGLTWTCVALGGLTLSALFYLMPFRQGSPLLHTASS